MSMKNPLTPAGIEPATFRFVVQHLNHCATATETSTRNISGVGVGGKGSRYVGLATLPTPNADCLEGWEP